MSERNDPGSGAEEKLRRTVAELASDLWATRAALRMLVRRIERLEMTQEQSDANR